MRIDIVSIFPEYFSTPLSLSLLGRARDEGLVEVHAHDLRSFTNDKHRQVDDTPYGGGPGMVMKPEPFFRAFEALFPGCLARTDLSKGDRVIMLTPNGVPLTQHLCSELSVSGRLVLLCGRYEGVDARVENALCTDSVSIGDYVLMGGEAAALVLIEAVVRLLPGVLGCEASFREESFSEGLLEYPQYTKPERWAGLTVPEVLLSGDHGRIAKWRRRESLVRTKRLRPELVSSAELSDEDLRVIEDGPAGLD